MSSSPRQPRSTPTPAELLRHLDRALTRIDALELTVAAQAREIGALREGARASHRQVQSLRHELGRANERIEELTTERDDARAALTAAGLDLPPARPVAKTSENSHLPPSNDPPGAGAKTHGRYPDKPGSGRSRGGQKGHRGVGPAWTAEPDELVTHTPASCPDGHDLADAELLGRQSRQVVSVVRSTRVVQHDVETVRCPTCTAKVSAVFPDGVSNFVVWDDSVRAAILSLVCAGSLPMKASCDQAGTLLGVRPSPGVVAAWVRDLGGKLLGWDEAVRATLAGAPVLFVDETPVKVNGLSSAYVHVACNEALTRYHLGDRSGAGVLAGGILGRRPDQWLVCDRLTFYAGLAPGRRQPCWAHLERDLVYFDQVYTPMAKGRPDPDRPHPLPGFARLVVLARLAVRAYHRGRTPLVDVPARFALELAATQAALRGPSGIRPRVGTTAREADNLLCSLAEFGDDLWLFTRVEGVEPTNNASERALRHFKVKARRSGPFQSAALVPSWLRIASYLESARKAGVGRQEALLAALVGNPVAQPIV